MPILEEQSKNLENELLKGLRNLTTFGDIKNQVVGKSKFLSHVVLLDNPGDQIKIIGLKSNLPKQYTWDYDEKKFAPNEVVTYKAEITQKSKLIFSTVFSEPIEKLAVGDKVHDTVAKQAAQVSYDIANFYDKEFAQKIVSDLSRYNPKAIVKLNASQLRDMQLVGEIAITAGFQMTSPSTIFNKRGEECNVEDVKKLLCLVDYSLYGRGKVCSIYTAPSPVLKELEQTFTVIPCSMANNVKLALIESGSAYLWTPLHQRYLKLDEYVMSHKVLDHVWREWILVDFRPAFAIVYDEKATGKPFTTPLFSGKNILTDYADLKDTTKTMTEDQAKEWEACGFSYEQAKEWIEAGFLVSDADFAYWMIDTKSQEEDKYQNYDSPEWCLNNLGQGDHKTIENLRKEFTGDG
jgi:hypothetical protein